MDVEVYYAHRAEGYDDMAGVMFSVDLPLFQSKRQDKDYAADVSRSMQAVDQLTLLKREHIARCKRWWRSIRLRKRCGSDSGTRYYRCSVNGWRY